MTLKKRAVSSKISFFGWIKTTYHVSLIFKYSHPWNLTGNYGLARHWIKLRIWVCMILNLVILEWLPMIIQGGSNGSAGPGLGWCFDLFGLTSKPDDHTSQAPNALHLRQCGLTIRHLPISFRTQLPISWHIRAHGIPCSSYSQHGTFFSQLVNFVKRLKY